MSINNRYCVLIIEDESNIRRFMMAALSSGGYKVITAKDAQQGKVMMSSYRPDVVLLDLGLPDMDGLDFIADVRGWSMTPIRSGRSISAPTIMSRSLSAYPSFKLAYAARCATA